MAARDSESFHSGSFYLEQDFRFKDSISLPRERFAIMAKSSLRGIFVGKERPVPIVRVINPAKRKGKSNPFGGVLISAMNTSKRTSKKPRSAAQKAATRRMLAARAASNPSMTRTKTKSIVRYRNGSKKTAHRVKRYAKRNGLSIGGFSAGQVAEGGVGAGIGFLATGAASQKLFGKYNESWVGYLLTLALGVGGGYAINRWAKRPVLATGFVFGTAGAVARRVYEEKVVKVLPAAIHMITGEKTMGDVAFEPRGIRALSGYYHTTGGDNIEIGDRFGYSRPAPVVVPGPRHMAVA